MHLVLFLFVLMWMVHFFNPFICHDQTMFSWAIFFFNKKCLLGCCWFAHAPNIFLFNIADRAASRKLHANFLLIFFFFLHWLVNACSLLVQFRY